MKVFVTGASGFIGSVTVRDLIAAGHQVVGLVRSDKSATSVAAMGAEVLRGDLDDLESLRRGHDTQLGTLFVDHQDLRDPDHLVHAQVSTDGLSPSSSPFRTTGTGTRRPGRPKREDSIGRFRAGGRRPSWRVIQRPSGGPSAHLRQRELFGN